MKRTIMMALMCLAALTMQAQRYCVVLPFQVGDNVTAEETERVTHQFRTNFNPQGYIKPHKESIEQAIQNRRYSRTNMTLQQQKQVGRDLEASIIIEGVLNKDMGEYSVEVRAIDVARGTSIGSVSTTFGRAAEYREPVAAIAQRLAQKVGQGGGGSSSSYAGSSSSYSAPASSSSVPRGYVDLGLPSGTYWKAINESGFYTYDEAVSRFGSKLPSDAQYQELKDYCTWTWTGSGYKVVGSNGNSIVLPAAGFRYCDGSVDDVGEGGNYWSSAAAGSGEAMDLDFSSGGVGLDSNSRCDGFSVRLVQD